MVETRVVSSDFFKYFNSLPKNIGSCISEFFFAILEITIRIFLYIFCEFYVFYVVFYIFYAFYVFFYSFADCLDR